LVYSENKATTAERCCIVACVYYDSLSYKGLLGVFYVWYMLRKKKMLGIKHGCQGYQVCLTGDEKMQRTWLYKKREREREREREEREESKEDYSSQT
jgi:hypothetical protein